MKIKLSASYIVEQFKELEFKKDIINKSLEKKEAEDLSPEILGSYYFDLDLIELQLNYISELVVETTSNQ